MNKVIEAEVKKLEKMLIALNIKSEKASEARRNLPPGSTRAKVTTANARWSAIAEERDRVQVKLDNLKVMSI